MQLWPQRLQTCLNDDSPTLYSANMKEEQEKYIPNDDSEQEIDLLELAKNMGFTGICAEILSLWTDCRTGRGVFHT